MYIHDDNTSIYAVTLSDHVKNLLEVMTEKTQNEDKKDLFEKGDYKYARCSTNSKPHTNYLIQEHGLLNAKRIWAKEKRSYKIFAEAQAQHVWEETVKQEDELEEQARR